MKTLFICNIDAISKRDEGATKSTIEFIKNISGEKIILSRFSNKFVTSSNFEPNIEIIRIPSKERLIYNPLFAIDYVRYILTTFIVIFRTKPDEVYFIPFKYSHPLGQVHAFILSILSRNFREILYQKPKINFIFKIFTRFKIGVISKDTELWLKNKGFDTFYFPVMHQKPNKSYNKRELRKKYGFDEDNFIILHVGHAVLPRGIDVLGTLAEYISDKDRILIVLSSWHKKNKSKIKKIINNKKIVVMDRYIEDIYEIYAIADVYVFPIKHHTNAIDIPLSILEAKELNLPIIASDVDNIKNIIREYGEDKIYLIRISTSEAMAREIHEIINRLQGNNQQKRDYEER